MELALILVPIIVIAVLAAFLVWALRESHLRQAHQVFPLTPVAADLATVEGYIAANNVTIDKHFLFEETGELDRLAELCTNDVVWEAPGRGQRFEGKAALEGNYRHMFGGMRDLKFQNLRRFATEEWVVDDSVATFVPLGGNPFSFPDGRPVELRLVHIFEMRHGKISKEIAFEIVPQSPKNSSFASSFSPPRPA